MKNLYVALICSFSILIISSAQADNTHAKKARTKADSSADKINCDEASTQYEMNVCAGEQLRLADEELNRLYKEKLDTLTSDRESFRDMQRAWLVFRDKACFYETGPREEGGSSWPLSNAMCMEYHTKKRIEDIKKYLKCTQNGCPY